MAQYQITYSCGHSATKQLLGKVADRERYIAWAERSAVCPDCAKADDVNACEAIEAEYDLPALDGSAKQIAWARNIRREQFAKLAAHLESLRAPFLGASATAERVASYEANCERAIGYLRPQAQAAYWIDNRYKLPVDMVKTISSAKPAN